jgi:hypothetical protein
MNDMDPAIFKIICHNKRMIDKLLYIAECMEREDLGCMWQDLADDCRQVAEDE